METICHNQKGGVLTSLLLLLPLIGSLLFLSLTLRHFLTVSAQAKYICRSESLESQKRARQSIQKLFALNPRALSLQKQYVAALVRLETAKLTGFPPVIAAAQAKVTWIEIQKMGLQMRQQQIQLLYHGRQLVYQQKVLRNFRQKWGSDILRITITPHRHNRVPLAVEKGASYVAPPYQKQNRFSESQKNYYSWVIKMNLNLPFIKEQQWSFRQSCSASLEEKNLSPELKKDNALLRYL